MSDLIARLERGERWDGDNAEVLVALGWTSIETRGRYTWRNAAGAIVGWGSARSNAPSAPLDSVDDALRLVPDGLRLYDLWHQEDDTWSAGLYPTGDVVPCEEGDGPTAAIALTIAILRARETDHA